MVLFKSITVLFVCLALLVSGVAEASVLCCLAGEKALVNGEMTSMEGKQPCHEDAANAAEEQIADCIDCNCAHGIHANGLVQPYFLVNGVMMSVPPTYKTQRLHSRQPDSVFQPPRRIS